MGRRFVYDRKAYWTDSDSAIVRIEDESGPVVEIITQGDSSYAVAIDEDKIEKVSDTLMYSNIAYAHEVKDTQ